MARRRRDEDDDFDQRLENEIITDAKPDELWIGWYYYRDDRLGFPFKARCIAERPTSPLRVGEVVEVRGMPAEDVCEHDMFVNIGWQDRLVAVPLVQLAGIAADEGTEQAIQDWRTWVERGYVL
jgi:hypothetical protein